MADDGTKPPEGKRVPKEFALRVECRAGYRGDEDVRRFYLGGRAVEVVRTLDRWAGVDHRYFKVEGDDGGIYLLRQDTAQDVWELIQYKAE